MRYWTCLVSNDHDNHDVIIIIFDGNVAFLNYYFDNLIFMQYFDEFFCIISYFIWKTKSLNLSCINEADNVFILYDIMYTTGSISVLLNVVFLIQKSA